MLRTLFCLVVVIGLSPAASACDGLGYGCGIGFMYQSLQYQVPYFAAHPPVYYSHPVPRTYGHSPFAYPPHFRTPEIVESAGPVLVNPYVPSSTETPSGASDDDRQVSVPTSAEVTPLVVDNPFCAGDSVAATR